MTKNTSWALVRVSPSTESFTIFELSWYSSILNLMVLSCIESTSMKSWFAITTSFFSLLVFFFVSMNWTEHPWRDDTTWTKLSHVLTSDFKFSQNTRNTYRMRTYLNVCTIAVETLAQGVQDSLTNHWANFWKL